MYNHAEKRMILTNKNDIYVYFEVIRQLEPDRILDIGMFFKRIGGVSRQLMKDCEVSEEIILDGVDFWPEIDFPVWKVVYDHILNRDTWFVDTVLEKYDLAIMFGIKELSKRADIAGIAKYIKEKTRYLLMDEWEIDWRREFQMKKIIPLNIDADSYYLIDFGE